VILTALDVLIVLYLQNKGFRYIEALVVGLISVIGISFFYELIISSPSLSGVFVGFIPTKQIIVNPSMLYIAIGILGATVMPHNLYLHSSIVQTRKYSRTTQGRGIAIKFSVPQSFMEVVTRT
jgi:manganese transport protein